MPAEVVLAAVAPAATVPVAAGPVAVAVQCAVPWARAVLLVSSPEQFQRDPLACRRCAVASSGAAADPQRRPRSCSCCRATGSTPW
uniref:Putative secreted protein n=1 Tax=Ixodes ricinus TaxID=34613 RepID=A0A147BU49_IXORI